MNIHLQDHSCMNIRYQECSHLKIAQEIYFMKVKIQV